LKTIGIRMTVFLCAALHAGPTAGDWSVRVTAVVPAVRAELRGGDSKTRTEANEHTFPVRPPLFVMHELE
jgi:hypothetical protein